MISARLVGADIIQCKRKTEKYSQTTLFQKDKEKPCIAQCEYMAKKLPIPPNLCFKPSFLFERLPARIV
jgi:hypothetical protein